MNTPHPSQSSHNFIFWFHLLITILAWLGPFLFSWYFLVPVYLIVVLQFAVFKRCLLNAGHKLNDDGDTTFYSYLLEKAGWRINRAVLKRWVRRYIYLLLAVTSLCWQLLLEHEPLLF